MKKDLANLEDQFNSMKTKYQDLIFRSISDAALRLEGVDGLQMSGSGIKNFRISTTYGTGLPVYYSGEDIRNVASNGTILSLAEQFAISELMLTGGSAGGSLSSSINIVAFGGFRANSDKVYVGEGSTTPVLNRSSSFQVDSHYVGSHAHLILHTKYARALSSCIYELIVRLKSVNAGTKSLFDSTLIAVTTEFNRNNDQTQVGSNHGYTGSAYTMFSGMIPETQVVGNIQSDPVTPNGGGTWGQAAPMEGSVFRGESITLGNAVSTACQILDVPSPTPLYPSLVMKSPTTGMVSVPSSWSRPKNIPPA
jgi:hypothetical protein